MNSTRRTDLAGRQNMTDFAYYGLVATEVCGTLKNETEIVSKVVAQVHPMKFDGEANDAIVLCSTGNETST
jgi:hypothetical protein